MIELIPFIVLTHFFQFNQLKILRQPGSLLFSVKVLFLQCGIVNDLKGEFFCFVDLIMHPDHMCIVGTCSAFLYLVEKRTLHSAPLRWCVKLKVVYL